MFSWTVTLVIPCLLISSIHSFKRTLGPPTNAVDCIPQNAVLEHRLQPNRTIAENKQNTVKSDLLAGLKPGNPIRIKDDYSTPGSKLESKLDSPPVNQEIHRAAMRDIASHEPILPQLDKINQPPDTRIASNDVPSGPGWIQPVMKATETLANIMKGLKIDPPSSGCSAGHAKIVDLAECALDDLFMMVEAVRTVTDVMNMNLRILSGGQKATKALIHLHELAGNLYGLAAMRALKTPLLTQVLARKEQTPDFLRGLALSLQTLISGLPAVVVVNDVPTGSFSHLDIVMPSVTVSQNSANRLVKASQGASFIDDAAGLPHGFEVFSLNPDWAAV